MFQFRWSLSSYSEGFIFLLALVLQVMLTFIHGEKWYWTIHIAQGAGTRAQVSSEAPKSVYVWVCLCRVFSMCLWTMEAARRTERYGEGHYQWKIEAHTTEHAIAMAAVQGRHYGAVSAWMITHWVIFWEIGWTGRGLFWQVCSLSAFLSIDFVRCD